MAMIYQELALAPHLTVEANILLGQERVRAGLIRRREHRRIVAEALELLEHPDIRPEAQGRRPGRRGPATGRGRPGPGLAGAGHRLRRADQLALRSATPSGSSRSSTGCDAAGWRSSTSAISSRRSGGSPQTYTVLRDGRAVAEGELAGTDLQVDHRATWSAATWTSCSPACRTTPGEPILELEDFRGRKTAQPGEPGRSGGARSWAWRGWSARAGPGWCAAVFGLEPVVAGRVRVAHVAGRLRDARERRIAQGVGFLSEDRKGEGLALGRSIEDNVTYSGLRRHARRGWLRLKERRAEVARWIARLRIAATGPRQAVGGLSGGNQQKVALARLLHQQADVLLLDEPTRGIDVGSKAEIYRLIGELAAAGQGRSWSSARTSPSCSASATGSPSCRAARSARPAPSRSGPSTEVMEVATRGDAARQIEAASAMT